MPTFQAEQLKQMSAQVFVAAGANADEARIVSDALVEANLAGHDSLERLDPESDKAFYFRTPDSYSTESRDSPKSVAANVQNWIDIAFAVDRAARVLIDVAFHQAAQSAADEKTSTWLKNAAGLADGEDRSVIIRLLSTYQGDDGEGAFERTRSNQEGALKSKIEKVDAFLEIATSLRLALTADLERISKERTSTEGNNLV